MRTSAFVLAALLAVTHAADTAATTGTTSTTTTPAAATTCVYDTDCTTSGQCCLVSQSDAADATTKKLTTPKATSLTCGATTDAKDDTTAKVVKTCYSALATAAKSTGDCEAIFGEGYALAALDDPAKKATSLNQCVPTSKVDATAKTISVGGVSYTATLYPDLAACTSNAGCGIGEACALVAGNVSSNKYSSQVCVTPDSTNKNTYTDANKNVFSVTYNLYDCINGSECRAWYGDNACCLKTTTQKQTTAASADGTTPAAYADDATITPTQNCATNTLGGATIPLTSTQQLTFTCENGMILQAGVAFIVAMLSIIA